MGVALYGTVLTDGRELERCRVEIEDQRIASVRPGVSPERGDLAVEDGWIAPGLIDLHIHGIAGVDLTSASDPDEAVATAAVALAARGITAFCPSVVSSRAEIYPPLLEAYAPKAHPGGAESLGVHLEGPFLDPERRGIHEASALRHATAAEIASWLAVRAPALVTLAPELPGGMDALRQLRAAGVIVSLGHSSADLAQALAALEAGATHGTHLFNAMPPLHHRRPGLAGALLASDATLEIIADGAHVDPLVIELVLRMAGPERVTLVTDGLAPTGRGPGQSRLGETVVVSDGRSVRRADGVFAGTALSLDECVRNLASYATTWPPAALAQTATAAPAATLGPRVAARKGRIAEGYDADVVVLDRGWHVRSTYVRGTRVTAA